MATPHQSRSAPAVSLRLGHATALTVHRTVIHYRSAASLPQGEAYYRHLPHSGQRGVGKGKLFSKSFLSPQEKTYK